MKKLVEVLTKEFKEFCKKIFRPMKSKWFLGFTIGLTTALFLYDERQLAKENYNLLPKQESEVLQRYDGGIKGIYTLEDMRKLLIDYNLTPRETPKEIPELMRVRMKKVDEPNDYTREANISK